jgi:hypothetical protein
LHALSKTEAQEDLDESGPKNVQELLDERSDAIYAKLMAISKTVD